MGKDSFSFKQFVVRHDRCGQKVGTDGVLLGAWANGGKRILDIGTGSGLIALMMAQRFLQAAVTGIEIDEEACKQACENVRESKFYHRISLFHSPLQSFSFDEKFDSIVSNPPFFVDSLKAAEVQRTNARHTDSLSFRDLIVCSERLMGEDSTLSLIVPTDAVEPIVAQAALVGLRLSRRCDVKTVERKAPKRSLLELTNRRNVVYSFEVQLLNASDGSRSEWYHRLTKDFYL
ncbi:tRNA1(Val) (adenine(37)-N6)-methyltransferase [Prevotella sp.]|uniref:tRNA1(Val) (adenine(37)-N6)-methyltransferase n=1 Tax=Prevotella sp. TaxID=59823 RepID=UPI002F924638